MLLVATPVQFILLLRLSVFFPGAFLSSRVTGAFPVTTDLIMRVDVRTAATTTTTTVHAEMFIVHYYFFAGKSGGVCIDTISSDGTKNLFWACRPFRFCVLFLLLLLAKHMAENEGFSVRKVQRKRQQNNDYPLSTCSRNTQRRWM